MFGKEDEIDDMWHDRVFSKSKTWKNWNPFKAIFIFLSVYAADFTISSFVQQELGPFTWLTSNLMPRVGHLGPDIETCHGRECGWWPNVWQLKKVTMTWCKHFFSTYCYDCVFDQLGQYFRGSLCLQIKHVQNRSSFHFFLKIEVDKYMKLLLFLSHVLMYLVWCKLALVSIQSWNERPIPPPQ